MLCLPSAPPELLSGRLRPEVDAAHLDVDRHGVRVPHRDSIDRRVELHALIAVKTFVSTSLTLPPFAPNHGVP